MFNLLDNQREEDAETLCMLMCVLNMVWCRPVEPWPDKHIAQGIQREGRPCVHLQNGQKRLDFHQHNMLAFCMSNRVSPRKGWSHYHHKLGLVLLPMIMQAGKMECRIYHFACAA